MASDGPLVVPSLNVIPLDSTPFSLLPEPTSPSRATFRTTTSSSSSASSVVRTSVSTSTSTSTNESTSTLSHSTPTTQFAENDLDDASSKSGPNAGLIAGLVIGLLVLLALVLFLVRWMFIRHRRQHRESGQRLAYSKARYAISAPSNFTVLQSGTVPGNGIERPGTSMSGQPSLEDRTHAGDADRVGSPEHMRERYPFEAMSSLESGLKDQMQTMKTIQLSSRKPVPVYTEADSR